LPSFPKLELNFGKPQAGRAIAGHAKWSADEWRWFFYDRSDVTMLFFTVKKFK